MRNLPNRGLFLILFNNEHSMKYTILTAALFLLNMTTYAQGFKIVALNDSFQRVDSVTFGYLDNATLGIDAQLGEVNIFNRPIQAYDMRVIQRDSMNFSCSATFLYDFNSRVIDTLEHYYATNFDSKINFRSNRDTSFLNRLFEVKFLTLNINKFLLYPLKPNQYAGGNLNGFRVDLDSCLSKTPVVISWLNFDKPPPTFGSARSTLSNFVFLFPPGFVLDSKEATIITKTRVYPNPASDVLTIDNIEVGKVKALRLFDILGREVLNQKVEGSESVQLNVSQLSRGTYLLTLYNDAAQPIYTKTVVK
jgi:hypothetical protein